MVYVGSSFAQTKSLAIGQRMPNLELKGMLDRKGSYDLTSLYKGKLLLISFWATWCVPCIKEMKLLDSLKQVHPDKFEVLSVTRQSESTLRAFLGRTSFSNISTKRIHILPLDTLLSAWFPHKVVPHNVWVDSTGTIVAITSGNEVNEANILNFQKNQLHKKWITKKDDFTFNKLKPFRHGDSIYTYRSIISPQIPTGNNGAMAVDGKYKVLRYFQWNCSISHIFYELYARYAWPSRITWKSSLLEIHTSDSARLIYPTGKFAKLLVNSGFSDFRSWAKTNTYCYELSLPDSVDRDTFLRYAYDDLYRQFHIRGNIETRKIQCIVVNGAPHTEGLKLVSTAQGRAKIRIAPGREFIMDNANIQDVISWMMGLFDESQLPFPLKSAIADRHRLRFSFKIKLPGDGLIGKTTPQLVMDVIEQKIGFKFHQQTSSYPVLVLRDERQLNNE